MAYIDVSALAGISLLAGIDPVTRDFFLSAATADASVHPIDLYKEMRICRRLDENLRGFDLFLASFGNVAKGGGKFTERYVQELLGTRFIPYDISHELTIIGTVITDDGQEGVACFDRSPLTATTVVDISYVPPQVEVVRAEAELAALVKSAYSDRVVITTSGSGYAGTGLNVDGDYIGTKSAPSDNITDAKTIADSLGISEFLIQTSLTIPAVDYSLGYFFKASSPTVVLTVANGASLDKCEFISAQVLGDFTGFVILRNSLVGNITNFVGFFDRCALLPGSTIGLGAGQTSMVDCLTNGGVATINSAGNVVNIVTARYVGDMTLINTTAIGSVIDMHISGDVILDATNTEGTFTISGEGSIDDSTTLNATVDVKNFLSSATLENSLFFDGIVINASRGVATAEGLVGTHQVPIISDIYAEEVTAVRGIKKYYLEGVNVITEDHSDEDTFVGAGALTSITVVDPGAVMTGATMINQVITGTVDGNMTILESVLVNLIGPTGIIKECGIDGSLTLGNVGNSGKVSITDCDAISPGATIDATAAGSIINGSRLAGTWTLSNKTGAEKFNFNFASGHLTIDATCTAGIVHVMGGCVLTDNSGSGCTVMNHSDIAKIDGIVTVLGLDTGNPVTIGNGSYLANGLQIDVTDNLDGTYTLNRTV